MKKIVVLFKADFDNRKGLTNAVLERIAHLQTVLPHNYEIVPICISEYNGWLARKLRHKALKAKLASVTINDIEIRIFWEKFSILNYIMTNRLKQGPIFKYRNSKLKTILSNCDLISAHSFESGLIAQDIAKRTQVPFCITWHGSDIHSLPKESKYYLKHTKELLSNAKCNFFVSQALMNSASKYSSDCQNTILYNGANELFYKYDESKRLELREKYHISPQCKLVAFVGNLVNVKNADLLPDIFIKIKQNYIGKVKFWIIGDGKLRAAIENKIAEYGIQSDVKLMGNMPFDIIPELMNTIDLLVLPSRNEGLPLVTVEALRSGAMVIGSNVGGIAEAIGNENVVDLGDDFIECFSRKCIDALNGKYLAQLNEELNWEKTAKKEIDIYKSIIN